MCKYVRIYSALYGAAVAAAVLFGSRVVRANSPNPSGCHKRLHSSGTPNSRSESAALYTFCSQQQRQEGWLAGESTSSSTSSSNLRSVIAPQMMTTHTCVVLCDDDDRNDVDDCVCKVVNDVSRNVAESSEQTTLRTQTRTIISKP